MSHSSNPAHNPVSSPSSPTSAASRSAYGAAQKNPKLAEALNAKPTPILLLKSLRKHAFLASFIGLLVGSLLGAVAWFSLPEPPFTVKCKLWLKQVPTKIIFPIERENNFTMFQKTQQALIRSRLVLGKALDALENKNLSIVRDEIEPVSKLEKLIDINFNTSPEIIEITLEGDKPEELRLLLDQITKSYLDVFKDKEQETTNKTIKKLQELRNEQKPRLDAKRRELHNLAISIGHGDVRGIEIDQQLKLFQLNFARQELMQIAQKKLKLKSDMTFEEKKYFVWYAIALRASPPSGSAASLLTAALLEKHHISDADPLPPPTAQIIDKEVLASVQALEQQKRKLEYDIEKAPIVLAPDVAKAWVKKKTEELEKVKEELENLKKNVTVQDQPTVQGQPQFSSHLEFLKDQWRALVHYESTLKKELNQLQQDRVDLTKAQMKMEDLRKEITRLEGVVDAIDGRRQALEVETKAPSRVVPLQDAVIYPPKLLNKRNLIVGMAGFGSFALVLLGFAWLQFQTRRIDTREQITETLGLNLIGALPDFSYRSRIRTGSKQPAKIWEQIVMDSVDAARTMMLSANTEKPLNVVMVTSAVSGEAKTSTSGHLAASLARAGYKTLLMDMDLRNPTIHHIFHITRSPGFCEFIRESCDIVEVVQPTATENLSLLTAGQINNESYKSLSQSDWTDLFARLRQNFDFIVMDSSPVLLVPESQLLSRFADGVIISVLLNVSKLSNVYAATDLLSRLKTRLLGAIINGVRDKAYASSKYYSVSS